MVWIQWAFDVLIVLLKWFVLQTNVDKVVAVVCQPGPISRLQSTSAYGRQMTSKGGYRCMRQRQRVVCAEFGA